MGNHSLHSTPENSTTLYINYISFLKSPYPLLNFICTLFLKVAFCYQIILSPLPQFQFYKDISEAKKGTGRSMDKMLTVFIIHSTATHFMQRRVNPDRRRSLDSVPLLSNPATITGVNVCIVKAKNTWSQKDLGVQCLKTRVDILNDSFFNVNDDNIYIRVAWQSINGCWYY